MMETGTLFIIQPLNMLLKQLRIHSHCCVCVFCIHEHLLCVIFFSFLVIFCSFSSCLRFTGLDLIPREESGELIDPMTSGVMHLFKVVSTRPISLSRSLFFVYVCIQMKTMSQSVESSSNSVSHVPGTVVSYTA